MERVVSGYPRFVIHPLVQELARHTGRGRPCLPFPSARAAQQAASFVRRMTKAETEVVSERDIFSVITTGNGTDALRSFWQHTGLIVSSRQAEALLGGKSPEADGILVRASLRQQ